MSILIKARKGDTVRVLLEALEAARDDLRRRHIGWDTSQPLAEMVNAAIAHAKGEETVELERVGTWDGRPVWAACKRLKGSRAIDAQNAKTGGGS